MCCHKSRLIFSLFNVNALKNGITLVCTVELGWYCSNRSKGTKCDFLSSLFMGLVAEPSCHMWHISYMFAVGISSSFFNILYIHTHPHACTRTSVWVHWNIALDVPICVAVYFLSIATFSITSSVQDFVLFLTDKKNVFIFLETHRVSYNLFIIFLLATCGPFYPQDGLFQFARLLSSFVSWVGNTISLMNLWWLPEIHTLSNSTAATVWLKTWQKGVSEIYICIRILMTDLLRANGILSTDSLFKDGFQHFRWSASGVLGFLR